MKNNDISAADWPARKRRLAARKQELQSLADRGQLTGIGILELALLAVVPALREPPPCIELRDELRESLLPCIDVDSPITHTLSDWIEAGRDVGEHVIRSRSATDMLYVSGRTYAPAERITVIEVPEALQYSMLLTDPPDVILEEDIVLPAEVFAISIPMAALNSILERQTCAYAVVLRSPRDPREYGEGTVQLLVAEAGVESTGPNEACSTMVVAAVGGHMEYYDRTRAAISGEDTTQTHGLELSLLLRNYIFNVLIYLGTGSAKMESVHAAEIAKLSAIPKKKRRKVQQSRLERLSSETTYRLTTDLVLDSRVKSFVLGGGLREARGSLKGRTLVRGHWKHKVHGVGRKLRTRIQVEYYYRGPQPADQLAATVHTYHLKG